MNLARHRLLAGGVTAAGAALLAFTVAVQSPEAFAEPPVLLWVLVAAVVAGELRPVSVLLRGRESEVLASTTFAFAALIAFGPGAALPALCVASLIGDLARDKPWPQMAFNVGQYAVGLSAAGFVLAALTDGPPGAFTAADVPAALAAGVVFFALNVGLVAAVTASGSGAGIRGAVGSELSAYAALAGFGLGLAPVIVVVGGFSVAMLPLLALPLVALHRNTRDAVLNEHQALHDPLTGLPNRVLFHDRVDQAIESGRRHARVAVVMVMDLDRFKEVNDSLGHYHGDRLLVMVGERLTQALRAEDTVARLGGDEFAVLLPSVPDRAYALTVAEKLLDTLRTPFDIDGLTLEVGASVGIACFPAHGLDKDALIQRADIAMYVAKGSRSGVRLYESEHDRHAVQRLALAGELRRAIDGDELELRFQPVVDVRTGAVLGAEALVRWQHPTLGLIMPSEFVSLAEHTGQSPRMTRRILSLALEQVAAWRSRGHRIGVAVNLCGRSFLDRRLLEDIAELLGRHNLDASVLQLDVTEGMIAVDPDRAARVLERLHGLGVTVAVDDFGTGYSSLSALRALPIGALKIDRSHLSPTGGDEAVVRTAVQLAHNLGLRAVAEGVEDAETLARLRELGCDAAQGHHIAQPLHAPDFERWLAGRPAPPSLGLARAVA